jgi:hypothetical protein
MQGTHSTQPPAIFTRCSELAGSMTSGERLTSLEGRRSHWRPSTVGEQQPEEPPLGHSQQEQADQPHDNIGFRLLLHASEVVDPGDRPSRECRGLRASAARPNPRLWAHGSEPQGRTRDALSRQGEQSVCDWHHDRFLALPIPTAGRIR